MSETENAIAELVARLNKIARKNRDEFGYKIEIPARPQTTYRFVCWETADGHEFVTGHGETILEAVNDAAASVKEACALWDYK